MEKQTPPTSSSQPPPNPTTKPSEPKPQVSEGSTQKVSVEPPAQKVPEKRKSPPTSEPPEAKKQKTAEQIKIVPFAPPPKHERVGKEDGHLVTLASNFYNIFYDTTKKIDLYSVIFEPVVLPPKCFGLLRCKTFLDKFGTFYVFDGTGLYLINNGKSVLEQNEEFKVTVEDFSNKEFLLRIKLVKSLELKNINQQATQLLGIIYRKALREMKLQMINRIYFDPNQKRIIKGVRGLSVCPGYLNSIIFGEGGGMLMNIDIKQKFIRQETALDVLNRLREDSKRRGGDWHKAFEYEIKDRTVLCVYNGKPYRIKDVKFDETPLNKFKRGNDEITYVDYFKSVYGKTIQFVDQPLLTARVKFKNQKPQEIKLIPELLYTTGASKKELSLCRKDVVQSPSERIGACSNFIRNLAGNKKVKDLFEKVGVGFQINTKPVNVEGIRLKPENVFFGSNKLDETSWNSKIGRNNCTICTPINLENWTIMYTRNGKRVAMKFLNDLFRVNKGLNVKIQNPKEVEVKEFSGDFMKPIADNTQIIVVVLDRENQYTVVKSKATERGLVVQCILAQKYERAKLSMTTNLLLQIEAKLGADLWTVDIPLKNYMIVGIDITHNQKKRGNSVGGFCASLNAKFTQFYSKAIFAEKGKKVDDLLKSCMIGALKTYYISNQKKLPAAIIIYRDGVGEGETDRTTSEEVEAIKMSFNDIPKPALDTLKITKYDPPLMYISVHKRITQKFFGQEGNLKNPGAGTIVDSFVTSPNIFQFYLMSTNVNQGCTNPVRYTVNYNSVNLKAKHIERLTFKLSHLYYNWTGTVKVPSPLMYARKCAEFIGQRLCIKDSEPIKKMESTPRLFFL